MYSPDVADTAVNEPPQNISTKVTVGDHPLSTAILVKLYVPYATKPNMKPVYNVFIKLPESTQGWITTKAIPRTYSM